MLKDLKTLRNLNIAAMVLAAIGIGACVFAFIMLVVANAAVSQEMSGSFTVDSLDIDGAMAYPDDTVSDLQALQSTIVIFGVVLFFNLIVSALSLVVAIQGMNVLKNEKRFNRMFVLFIVCAVINIVFGGFITGVLFIISAVFTHKLRKVPFSVLREQQAHPELMFVGPGYPPPAYPYAQPAQPYAQPGYAQAPYGQAPQAQPYAQASWGQPVQPAQPYGQPSAPAQPYTQAAPAAQPTQAAEPTTEPVSPAQVEQPASDQSALTAQAEAPVSVDAPAEAPAPEQAPAPVASPEKDEAAAGDGKKSE